jgi:hypothetical protein
MGLFSRDVVVDAQEAREVDESFSRLQSALTMSFVGGLVLAAVIWLVVDQPLIAIILVAFEMSGLYLILTIRRERQRALINFVNPVTGRIELPRGPTEPS